jgi:hypothetical protein
MTTAVDKFLHHMLGHDLADFRRELVAVEFVSSAGFAGRRLLAGKMCRPVVA